MNLPRLPIVVAVIALAAAAVTFFLTGNLLSPSIDEGIYIQGAHRIASGQVPYRDFFAFAGPITYWIEAAVEILAGRSVPAMRLAIALSVGLIAAGIVSVVQSFAGLRAGLSIAVLWFGITIDLWNRLEVNHRWISMGFYSAALICLFIGDRNIGKVRAFCAGAALALACWTTQSFAWPLSILAVYFFFAIRNRLPAFLLGAASFGIVPALVLANQGALAPMLENLRWIAVNYQAANRVQYGYYFADTPWRYAPHVWSSIWLPPFAAALGLFLILFRKQRDLIFPLVLVLAIFPTSYPKWDALQLMFISGPFFALTLAMVWRMLPKDLDAVAQAACLMPAVFFILHVYSMTDQFTSASTRAGNLIGNPDNVTALQQFEDAIPAGSKVFVYPYMTSLYPLLHIENPTRYEYLQPGMMTAKDEENVLSDLERSPPPFIFWHDFPSDLILKIWPNTDPTRLHFTRVENFIHDRYQPGFQNQNSYFAGRVWTLKR